MCGTFRNALLGLLVVGVSTTVILACDSSNDEDRSPPAALRSTANQESEEAKEQGRRSLDPRTFDRSCSVDADCALVEIVSDCDSCCNGAVAVRNTSELQTAIAELGQGCELRTACTMACFDIATCVGGVCTKQKPSDDAGADGG